jgi:uncharacterized RDD family membrane protein YckC
MESPQAPQPPEPPQGPQAPAAPEAPGAPEAPPGGWQQPIARPADAWAGRPLASWGSRLGAWFIDGLIVGVPATVVALLLVGGAIGIGNDDDFGFWAFIGALILSVVIFAIIALIYAPVTMARDGAHNGQTWGKQMLGIRVVRDGGETMSFGWAALREIVVKNLGVGIASTIIPFLPWFLNFFWPLWDDQNRALHDMIVSTHVVRA